VILIEILFIKKCADAVPSELRLQRVEVSGEVIRA
jgi:hypothetical protein